MSDENNTAITPVSDVAALVPTNADAMFATPVHKDSGQGEKRYLQVPYVAFRGQKSTKNIEALDAAGIAVDDFYLMDVTPVKVKPMSLHIIQFARFYTRQDDEGRVTDALATNEEGAFDDGFREHIVALVAVAISPGNFTPAICQLRSGQSAAFREPLQLLPKAMNDKEWAARGDKYAATLKVPFAGGRFRVTIWNTQELPKNGGKQKNNVGHNRIVPTPAEEVDALIAWKERDWANGKLPAAGTKFNAIVEFIRRKVAETTGVGG